MVRIIQYIIFLFGILYCQNLNITVDKNSINEGDFIQLSIESSGYKNFPRLDISILEDTFDIVGGPYEQTSIQWINGIKSKTKTLTWSLLPRGTGLINIPALKGTVDGKPFRGKPFNITVVKNGAANLNKSILIIADIDKDSVYLGEQITLTYKLYKAIDTKISGIEQFQMPDFNGFWVEEIFTPQRLQYQNQNVIIDGIKYQVANLGQRALFPIPSDKYVIPSVKLKTQIEIKKKNKRSDPFFDPFFDSFFNKTAAKVVKSEEKIINILPFPDPRPNDFYGAVGEFDIISEIDQDKIITNEGFTYKVSFKGTGNLALFTLPEIKFPDGLDAFPPISNFTKDAFRNEITGFNALEYVLVPRKKGTYEIPSVQMSYFNPKTRSWEKIKSNSHIISVEGDVNQMVELSGLSKKEVELMNKDIRFIFTEKIISWDTKKNTLKLSFIFFLLSLAVFVFPKLMMKYTNQRLFTSDSRRAKNALKTSIKILETEKGNSFDVSSKALYTYLQHRLLLKSHNLDPVSAHNILKELIDENLLIELTDLMKICDAGKYAPEVAESEDKIFLRVKNMIIRLNKII